MKLIMQQRVRDGQTTQWKGDIVEIKDKQKAQHYIEKGLAVEYKEEKPKKETKEHKPIRKRTTKSAKK